MGQRHILAIFFPIIYLIILIICVFNSGAGHDWGTGALLIASFPLGLIPLGLDVVFPKQEFILLCPLLGLFQYILIGYWLGRRIDRKATK